MKIVYVITSSNWGGAQQNVFQLLKAQVNNNDVSLIIGSNGVLASRVKKELPIVNVYILKDLVREISPIKDVKAFFKLRKLIKSISPDIVHLHSSKAGAIGRIACVHLGTKVVYTVHGWPFTEGIGSSKKQIAYILIEKILEPFTDEYICVSKYDENLGKKFRIFKSKKCNYITIHNGVSLPIVNNKLNNRKLPIRMIMVARFSDQKDQIGLIKALSEISREKYVMTFIGDGPNLNKAKLYSKALNLDDNIHFVGFTDHVMNYLLNSDLFILFSHYEGLPYSIIEAMSVRMPVIASNVGGNHELVKNGENGFLVNDSNDVVKAINKFIKNKNLISIMGDKSYSIFKKEFQLDNQLCKVKVIYDKLTSGEEE